MLVLNWYQVLYPMTGRDGGHSLAVTAPPRQLVTTL